jgi:hypothetical protein
MRVMCHTEGSEYPNIIISFFLVVRMRSSLMYHCASCSSSIHGFSLDA